MDESDFTHWLELPEGTKHVVFGDLPHLLAKALWPGDDDPESTNWAYGGARINLEDELPKAVHAGHLAVQDPLTLGPHTFPHGAALDNAVVLLPALRAFLARRGIGVRVASLSPAPHYLANDVLQEAAELAFPSSNEPDTQALAEAWRGWATSTWSELLERSVEMEEVIVTREGQPFDTQHTGVWQARNCWTVDATTRAYLLKRFSEDKERIRPTFDIPPRPTAVPPVLRLLPSATSLLIRKLWHMNSQSTGTAASAIDEIEQIISRQARGFLLLKEAAAMLQLAGCGPSSGWRDKLIKAALDEDFPMHEPETLALVRFSEMAKPRHDQRLRELYEWAHVDDLNAWLDKNERRLPYRFPATGADSQPAEEPAFLSPLSNGLWLIAEAAASLARQQQLSVEGRRSLSKRMGDCAQLPIDAALHLRTRHLETALPLPADEAAGLAVGVFPSDVNEWLAACRAGYAWNVAPSDAGGRHDAGSTPVEPSRPHGASLVPSLTTDEICEAFDKVGMTSLEWRTTITKNLPDWLKACRTMVGRTGANPVQAKWDPLKLSIALVTGLSRKAGAVPVAKLDAAFRRQPLQKFASGWAALRADNPAWGD